jgi:hypothetical protein
MRPSPTRSARRTAPRVPTSKLITLPQGGFNGIPSQENDDHNPDRVTPRHIFNLGIGTDNLLHAQGRRRLVASVQIENLTNTVALYNFLSTLAARICCSRERWLPGSDWSSEQHEATDISRFRRSRRSDRGHLMLCPLRRWAGSDCLWQLFVSHRFFGADRDSLHACVRDDRDGRAVSGIQTAPPAPLVPGDVRIRNGGFAGAPIRPQWSGRGRDGPGRRVSDRRRSHIESQLFKAV